MTNSIIVFNYCLHFRGLSRFTLLNSFRSLKSFAVSSNMIIFFLIELLYFSSLISTFKKIILKCGQYLLFCLFICFFTLFYSNANVVTRLNLNLYNLVGSFNLYKSHPNIHLDNRCIALL